MAKLSLDFLVLLVVLEGLISNSVGLDPATISAIVTVAGTVISSGSSMSSSPNDYKVVCAIEVENWTRFTLEDPHSTMGMGRLQSSPVLIRPGSREQFIAHKSSWFSGTYGVASWLINDRRAVVMWNCPYSFWWSKNVLGIGLTESFYGVHQNWFGQMYSGRNSQGLNFVRGEYRYETPTIKIADERFEITGTMGTGHKTTARIVIRPINDEDLAPSITNELDKQKKRDTEIINKYRSP
ncbi:tereporin-Ts1-like [Mytilus galloprovincialis]|uniref:echotoxin-2-like n=1 Tax=Mytilus edulis TaxID=6550 RepID=UPI0039EF36A7